MVIRKCRLLSNLQYRSVSHFKSIRQMNMREMLYFQKDENEQTTRNERG